MAHRLYPILKRFFDVITASLSLLMLLPVILAIALVALMTHGRPIFFTQVRPGLQEKPFKLYKFRTMDSLPERTSMRSEHSLVTDFGRLLRRFSLDELPQLWNVVRGDMSLIGPRPLLSEYIPRYNQRQSLRHSVRPGMTGLAQTRGRNLLAWEDRLELDAQYAENLTLRSDAKIFFQTLGAIVTGHGVTTNRGKLMEKFAPSARHEIQSRDSR